jgi:hypothetical protein
MLTTATEECDECFGARVTFGVGCYERSCQWSLSWMDRRYCRQHDAERTTHTERG